MMARQCSALALATLVAFAGMAAQARLIVLEQVHENVRPNVEGHTFYLVEQQAGASPETVATIETWESTSVYSSSSSSSNSDSGSRFWTPLTNPLAWLSQQMEAVQSLQRSSLAGLLSGSDGSGEADEQQDPQARLRQIGCNRFKPAMAEYASQQESMDFFMDTTEEDAGYYSETDAVELASEIDRIEAVAAAYDYSTMYAYTANDDPTASVTSASFSASRRSDFEVEVEGEAADSDSGASLLDLILDEALSHAHANAAIGADHIPTPAATVALPSSAAAARQHDLLRSRQLPIAGAYARGDTLDSSSSAWPLDADIVPDYADLIDGSQETEEEALADALYNYYEYYEDYISDVDKDIEALRLLEVMEVAYAAAAVEAGASDSSTSSSSSVGSAANALRAVPGVAASALQVLMRSPTLAKLIADRRSSAGAASIMALAGGMAGSTLSPEQREAAADALLAEMEVEYFGDDDGASDEDGELNWGEDAFEIQFDDENDSYAFEDDSDDEEWSDGVTSIYSIESSSYYDDYYYIETEPSNMEEDDYYFMSGGGDGDDAYSYYDVADFARAFGLTRLANIAAAEAASQAAIEAATRSSSGSSGSSNGELINLVRQSAVHGSASLLRGSRIISGGGSDARTTTIVMHADGTVSVDQDGGPEEAAPAGSWADQVAELEPDQVAELEQLTSLLRHNTAYQLLLDSSDSSLPGGVDDRAVLIIDNNLDWNWLLADGSLNWGLVMLILLTAATLTVFTALTYQYLAFQRVMAFSQLVIPVTALPPAVPYAFARGGKEGYEPHTPGKKAATEGADAWAAKEGYEPYYGALSSGAQRQGNQLDVEQPPGKKSGVSCACCGDSCGGCTCTDCASCCGAHCGCCACAKDTAVAAPAPAPATEKACCSAKKTAAAAAACCTCCGDVCGCCTCPDCASCCGAHCGCCTCGKAVTTVEVAAEHVDRRHPAAAPPSLL